MSYTPYTWTTGDIITAAKLNNIEDGIANAGGGWDAVIRLTHSEDSGADDTGHLTPSIVEGTFAGLLGKLQNGGCLHVLVEYLHPWGAADTWATAAIVESTATKITFRVVRLNANTGMYAHIGYLDWYNNDELVWG